MSTASGAESVLGQAKEREREYEWLNAAELYNEALTLIPEHDSFKMAHVYEQSSYAYFRAGMQAQTGTGFRQRINKGVQNCAKAVELYEEASEPWTRPAVLRCHAMTAYLSFWLANDASERRRLLSESWKLAKEALDTLKETSNAAEYGRTFNELASIPCHLFFLDWVFQTRENTIREAAERGERAVLLLSNVDDRTELCRALVKTALLLSIVSGYFVPSMDDRESINQKAMGYWKRASELSEETASLELLSMNVALTWNNDEMLAHYEKAMAYAKKAKDNYLIGNALDWLAFGSFWRAVGIEDPDKRLETFQAALTRAEDAQKQFSSISYASPRGGLLWTHAPHAEYHWQLALWQTDPRKRHDLLNEAVMEGTKAIKEAETAGYPDTMITAHHVLSKALGSLAQTETDIEAKKNCLENALNHRNKSIEITEQILPLTFWNRGVMWNYLADLKAELSSVEKGSEKKRKMLEEAISDRELCLQLCTKDVVYLEKRGETSGFAPLGYFQYSHGELLLSLYELTKDRLPIERAIKAFEDGARSFEKLDMVIRMAECHWKAARGHDTLGEHLKAAENFTSASDNYSNAAKKIPQLKSFYQEHSVYMRAWSEIETAKHHHKRQEYGLAKEHYEQAASMHQSLSQWSYISPNYSAWAQVENAEDLSRKDQSEETIRAFEEAVRLFDKSSESLKKELNSLDAADEKRMAASMLDATRMRQEYCVGRVALEEAKVLDKKGDHYSSSEKYRSAEQIFERMTRASESEQDREELKLILVLTKAWQKMQQAEAEISPELYNEASQLFEEAKGYSTSEKARMLALGHSRFCLALDAGTRFADTRDRGLHSAALQHLESAANYYVKAGFQSASEYAKATGLLLDAYMYTDEAKKESNPEKKAKFYTVAEKVLQSSAGSFLKAEHPAKREQVLRLLEKVKEERELAVSLSEVLHAPRIVSATAAFSSPAPTHENAVGLERFEHADIQANVITGQKNLKVGENLDLEIEMVNAGKGPATLVKLEKVIPEGFELTEKPESYRAEDNYLDLKGKRLAPLKTEEVRLILKPKVQGVFPLKPRILYLDENGKYKVYEVEQVTIRVKELGISGWLKGPEKSK